jgi:tetratricopeptide (TPR) repeat protein
LIRRSFCAHPRFAFLLLALLLAGHAFSQEEDPRDADRRFRFLQSRDEELRTQLDNLNSDSPPAVEMRLRARQHRLGTQYRHFLNDHPRHARAMVAYGSIIYYRGHEEEAVGWWEKAIAIDPREADAYNNIANHYGYEGRPADALKLYDKAIELAPTEPIFRFNWATTCVMFRKDSREVYDWTTEEIFQHSLEQFRKARDLAPQNFEFSNAYAETFYLMKAPDWQEMYAAWKYCLSQPLQAHELQYVYGHLARACIRLERVEEARTWLMKMDAPGFQGLREVLERKLAEQTATKPQP